MRIIYNKLIIHFLYYVVAIIAILTGYFKEFIIFTSIIFIHELGHVLAALYYKWNIDKIIILPFGGVTIFKEHLNKPIKQEFIIIIMGPLLQLISYVLYIIIIGNSALLINYNLAILFFNLIPIYPLDGSKLINILLNKYISFKKSHIITVYISFLLLIILLVIIITKGLSLVYILIITLLFLKVIDENKEHNFIFNKFLFERYVYNFSFSRRKIIYDGKLHKMQRDYKHLFYINKKYVLEKKMLQKKFDFK